MASADTPIRAAILGASGYTGVELIRWLRHHPQVKIGALTAESQAGVPINQSFPHLHALPLPLIRVEELDWSAIDLAFCCLPHAASQTIIAAIPDHVRIIDLSADFRLSSLAHYEQWYGHAHQAPDLQHGAVYGLSEWYAAEIASARLIANPGCYPTCSLLPLLPLMKEGVIASEGIIIDAMSGVSGAGRKAVQANLFCEVNESAKAYGVGGHRHVAEIEQELGKLAPTMPTISFTAHLVPMNRGMSATIHVKTRDEYTADRAREVLSAFYGASPFVSICAKGHIPATHEVRGTNQCKIAVTDDRVTGKLIIVSVIDNLVKGASGQAIQNMNLLYGWPESLGLDAFALVP